MRLFKYIQHLLENREKNGYEYLYFLIDVHNTILVPSFDKTEEYIYYDGAKEALQLLSKCKFIKLIMWTSTYKDKIDLYVTHFNENNIHFDFINENPMMKNTTIGCFNEKFFYDVGIDDKFGFDAQSDWKTLIDVIKPYICV